MRLLWRPQGPTEASDSAVCAVDRARICGASIAAHAAASTLPCLRTRMPVAEQQRERDQAADTVRPDAQLRSAMTFSAISTDKGLVR